MTSTYDEQLIDATAVRRRRLVGALVHGEHRVRRQFSDLSMSFLASGLIATLVAAGCVAVSFVLQMLSGHGI